MQRIELHTHTNHSRMDGVIDIGELLHYASEHDMAGIAITDHSTVSGYYEAQRHLEWLQNKGKLVKDFKMIYGTEVYLVDDLTGAILNEKGQKLDSDFVVVDIETTGIHCQEDEILEISAIKVCEGKIQGHLYCVVQQEQVIPEHISALTGITDAMAKEGITLREAMETLLKLIGRLPIISHGINFERRFLEYNARKFGWEMDNSWVDTLALSRLLLSDMDNYRLDNVAQALKIQKRDYCFSFETVLKIEGVYKKLTELLVEKGIKTFAQVNEEIVGNRDFIKNSRTFHATVLVKDMEGLKALYHAMSYAGVQYYNKRPRMPKSILRNIREHLLIGSACEAGEVFCACREGVDDEMFKGIISFYDYLEVQPDGNNQYLLKERENFGVKDIDALHEINRHIIDIGEQIRIPVVATSDAHYLHKEEAIARRALRHYPGYEQDCEDNGLYLRSTEEMLEEFVYLGREKAYQIVVENTHKIASQIQCVKPFYDLKTDNNDSAVKELRKRCDELAQDIYGEDFTEEIKERLEWELNAAEKYEYAYKFIWLADAFKLLNRRSVEVSDRAWINGSLIAYLLGITEVDPIKYQLLPYSALGYFGQRMNVVKLFATDHQIDEFFEIWKKYYGKDHVVSTTESYMPSDEVAEAYLVHYLQDSGETLDESERKNIISVIRNGMEDRYEHTYRSIIVPDSLDVLDYTPICLDDGKVVTDYEWWELDEMFFHVEISPDKNTEYLLALEKVSQTDSSNVSMIDTKVQEYICNLDSEKKLQKLAEIEMFSDAEKRDTFLKLRPQNFEELAKVYAMLLGSCVWKECQEELVLSGQLSLENIIATREDVLAYLQQWELNEEIAYKISERVRKGQHLTEEQEDMLRSLKVPEWFIYVCNTVRYLMPKGKAIAMTMQIWRLLYYKVFYPDKYQICVKTPN